MSRFWASTLHLLCVIMLLSAAACTPVVQPQSSNVELHAPRLEQGALILPDGARAPLRSWLPKAPHAPKMIVLALHGFNDYSHAFELPATWLSARGAAVYAYDQRGFGASQMQGIWAGEEHLHRDLQQAIAALRLAHPSTPLYLLGESMGAAIIINTCASAAASCDGVSGLILSAPALWGDDTLSGFYRASLWVGAHLMPASHWTGEDLDILATDNFEILRAMGADPLVIKATRTDAIYGLVRSMANAYGAAPQLMLPLLLLYGARDEIVPPMPVAKTIDALTAPNSVGYYAGGYHLLLRDLQREVVYKDILSWMDNRYRPLPSSADMGWKEELLGVD